MTFQLYGIIPIPAWLVVSGIFAYDTYSTVAKNVSTLLSRNAFLNLVFCFSVPKPILLAILQDFYLESGTSCSEEVGYSNAVWSR